MIGEERKPKEEIINVLTSCQKWWRRLRESASALCTLEQILF